MCVTSTVKTLTVCAFNVTEVRVYVKPAFVRLRSLRLRSGHPQAEAGALLDNSCRVPGPWTLDWVPPWMGPPILCGLLVGTLPDSSPLLLSPSTGVLCDGHVPGE